MADLTTDEIRDAVDTRLTIAEEAIAAAVALLAEADFIDPTDPIDMESFDQALGHIALWRNRIKN